MKLDPHIAYLIIPSTLEKIPSGSVVELSSYPDIRWIVKLGWYQNNLTICRGWYFYSIPDGNILPVSLPLIQEMSVIAVNDTHDPYAPPIIDEKDQPITFTKGAQDELRRTFISVDTLADRDALSDSELLNGKFVRVNNVEDSSKYYAYDYATQTWQEVQLDPDLSDYQTHIQAQEDMEILREEIQAAIGSTWGTFDI